MGADSASVLPMWCGGIVAIDGSRKYDLFFATHRTSRVGRKEARRNLGKRQTLRFSQGLGERITNSRGSMNTAPVEWFCSVLGATEEFYKPDSPTVGGGLGHEFSS